MSWFDEQVQQRKLHDDELVQASFSSLAGVILGKKITGALENQDILSLDAIQAVFRYYHIKVSEIPDNIQGVNDQLEYLARPNGMMRRDVKLQKGWHKDAVGAMLGVLKEDGSVVALIPGKLSGYYYYDSRSGKNVKITSANEGKFEDEAISFYKPFPLRKITSMDLIRYIKNQIGGMDIFYILLSSAMIALVGTRLPVLTSVLYDDVVSSGSVRLFFGIAIAMICVYISQAMFTTIKAMVLQKINTKIQNAVEAATMMRILSLPASFFKNYSAGELASYMGHINGLCQTLVNTIVSSSLTAAFSLVYVTNIASYAKELVIPSICMIVLTMVFTMVTSLIQIRYTRGEMKAHALESGLSFGLISGIQKIKLTGAEKRAFAKWGRAYSEASKYIYNQPAAITYSSVVTQAITLLGTFVMYYMAAKNHMTAAQYSAFMVAYAMMSGAFMGIATITASIASIRPTLDMARPIMDAVPETSEGKRQVSRVSGTIELSHVSFQYTENTPKVLDDVSLKIRAGQYIAIVGKTGCGKSTLMRLLLGFEKPQKGAVYYDGKDIDTIEMTSLRRRIGVVMQSGKLFNGDIFSNITIAAPWLTLQDAWEAAEIAGIADDIREMPMGMNTIISEGQGGISGGQKQRLMIARAVVTKPKILMMDEATSALDNITQKHVSEALDRLKCTRIVIAHRLSTIRQCDRIIVLDGGKIVEDGDYETLLSQDGLFAKLVKRQMIEQK